MDGSTIYEELNELVREEMVKATRDLRKAILLDYKEGFLRPFESDVKDFRKIGVKLRKG